LGRTDDHDGLGLAEDLARDTEDVGDDAGDQRHPAGAAGQVDRAQIRGTQLGPRDGLV
jgi:hypothetical protein